MATNPNRSTSADSDQSFLEEPEGLPWPASQLSSEDMTKLRIISNAVRKPTTRLLKVAVQLLWDATEIERQEAKLRSDAIIEEHRVKYEQSLQDHKKRRVPTTRQAKQNSSTVEGPTIDTIEPTLKLRTKDGTEFNT
jgi:hypothetical protein